MLSDDGYILDELQLAGITIKTSVKRKEFYERTLRVFNIKYNSITNELYVEFDDLTQFPKVQNNITQCVLRLSDMLLTARSIVKGIFLEEVQTYLTEQDIISTPDFQQIGTSGNVQTFEFQIPSFKNKAMLKFIVDIR